MATNSSAASTSATSPLPTEILLYVYGGTLWGVDVARVVRVAPVEHIATAPYLNDRLAGVIKYESQAVPVFAPPGCGRPDVAAWRTRVGHVVVLLEHESGLVGAMADDVDCVARPDEFMFETEGEVTETGEERVREGDTLDGFFVPRALKASAAPDEGRPFTFVTVSSILVRHDPGGDPAPRAARG